MVLYRIDLQVRLQALIVLHEQFDQHDENNPVNKLEKRIL
jgi:hypothetical protein